MLYNDSDIYNAVGAVYGGISGTTGIYPGLQLNLNRVIGKTRPDTYLDAQGAANVYAGTTSLDLLGALNAKAGTSGVGLNKVCNLIAGTTNLDADGASQYFLG